MKNFRLILTLVVACVLLTIFGSLSAQRPPSPDMEGVLIGEIRSLRQSINALASSSLHAQVSLERVRSAREQVRVIEETSTQLEAEIGDIESSNLRLLELAKVTEAQLQVESDLPRRLEAQRQITEYKAESESGRLRIDRDRQRLLGLESKRRMETGTLEDLERSLQAAESQLNSKRE